MLELSRLVLRRSIRRRSAGVLPGAAEICESRLLLSAATAGQLAETAAAEPAADENPAGKNPAGKNTAGKNTAGKNTAGKPPFARTDCGPPGEEDPGEEPGEDTPDDIEEQAPYFESLRSRLSADGTQIIITGKVQSLTGGDTVEFAGAATGSITVDTDGNFVFTFDYNGDGIVSATATDNNGTVGETRFLFL